MIERMFPDIAKFIKKKQRELHYIYITTLNISYTEKSWLILEAVQINYPTPSNSYVSPLK